MPNRRVREQIGDQMGYRIGSIWYSDSYLESLREQHDQRMADPELREAIESVHRYLQGEGRATKAKIDNKAEKVARARAKKKSIQTEPIVVKTRFNVIDDFKD